MSDDSCFSHLKQSEPPAGEVAAPERRKAKRPKRKPPGGEYDVGYCRPPKATRFKKGQSGNPRGRPKKCSAEATPPCAREALQRVLMADIPVRIGDEVTNRPVLDTIFLSLANKAVKGEAASVKLLMGYAEKLNVFAADKQSDPYHGSGVLMVREPCRDDAEWERRYGAEKIAAHQERMQREWEEKHGPVLRPKPTR